MSELLPLWQLLAPQNVRIHRWPEPESECLKKIISAREYEDPERWNRFLWHTAHIRELDLDLTSDSEEHREAQLLLIQDILKHNGGKSFLPALCRIEWLGRSPADACVFTPLFTSTLRIATFRFDEMDDPDPVIVTLLRRLRESSPFLADITIDVGYTPEAESSLVQELAAFDHLRGVTVNHLTQLSVFRDLITKSNVASVDVAEIEDPWLALSPPFAVHNLCELSLGGQSGPLISLFQSVRFQALTHAKLSLFFSPEIHLTVGDVISLLASFCTAVSLSSLQNLELSIDGFLPRDDPSMDEFALGDVVAPILPLRNMSCFRFSTSETIYWSADDADIRMLAQAWTKLEELILACATLPPRPTPSTALHHLYRYCPNPQEVVLPCIRCPVVGVDSIPAPAPDRAPHGLSYLYVHGCVPAHGADLSDAEAEGLARYILELFSGLDIEGYRLALDRWDRVRAHTHSQATVLPLPLDAVPVDAGWEKVMRFMCLAYEENDLQ
ncbi:hypothetical protein BD309DRAFT_869349 [Dichomitus squalens]|nr:hypothetical protein BD309DRAFT_869349 [Dichomitus squalens]